MSPPQSYPIHHIGYAVDDLSSALEAFGTLGYGTLAAPVLDEERGVIIALIAAQGYTLELISPARSDSIVSNLLKRRGSGPYHICYRCPDLDAALSDFEARGYRVISPAAPAPAFSGQRVAFLHSAALGIVELLEDGQ